MYAENCKLYLVIDKRFDELSLVHDGNNNFLFKDLESANRAIHSCPNISKLCVYVIDANKVEIKTPQIMLV